MSEPEILELLRQAHTCVLYCLVACPESSTEYKHATAAHPKLNEICNSEVFAALVADRERVARGDYNK